MFMDELRHLCPRFFAGAVSVGAVLGRGGSPTEKDANQITKDINEITKDANRVGQNPYTLWLCQNSYWKWPLIVDFPIKNGDFPLLC